MIFEMIIGSLNLLILLELRNVGHLEAWLGRIDRTCETSGTI